MLRLFRVLVWPKLNTISSAQSALYRGLWIYLACAVVSTVAGFGLIRNASGLLSTLVLLQTCGFVLIGLGIGAGSRFAALAAVAICATNLIAAGALFRQRPLVLAIELFVLLLLIASARAAFYLARNQSPSPTALAAWWSRARPVPQIATALFAAVMLLAVSLLAVFRAFIMPTNAMEPTLRIGDHFFALLPAFMGPVKRGDLVLLRMPGPNHTITLKRVVGLPGDHLRLIDGHLLLDNKPLREPYVLSPSPFPVLNFPATGTPLSVGPTYTSLVTAMYRDHVRNHQLVVPPASYFVLGDNRGNSLDSRYFGPVPATEIVGRPVYMYATAKATPKPPHALARYSLHS